MNMALKLGVCFSHQGSDAWKSRSLIRNIARLSRDLLDGVSTWSGRIGTVGKHPIVGTKVKSTGLTVACNIPKSTFVLKNVANVFFRSSQHTSRFAQRFSQHPCWSTFRAHKQFHSIGKRLATFSFVGVAFAGSQTYFESSSLTDLDEVCLEIREMFRDRSAHKVTSVDDLCYSNLHHYDVKDFLSTSTFSTTFESKLKTNVCTNERSGVTEESALVGVKQQNLLRGFTKDADSDGESDSGDSIEVIDSWDEFELIHYGNDFDSDDEKDGDAHDLICMLDEALAMVNQRQKKLNEISHAVSNQTKILENMLIDTKRGTPMTDRSVEYSNQVLKNELMAASESTVAVYDLTLSEYLASHTLTFSNSMIIFLQLLEAVVNFDKNNIYHRDLRSDNIFIELLPDGPRLLVANFDSNVRIQTKIAKFCKDEIPTSNYNFVTPPELFVNSTSYSKTDMWACGAIAYEIFSCDNPVRGCDNKNLASLLYDDSDLPDLPGPVPTFVNSLVKKMLKRDPSERPDAELAANIMHVGIWSPNEWHTTSPHWLDVKRWLVQFAAETYCSQHQWLKRRFNHSLADCLKAKFLSRSSVLAVSKAVYYMHDLYNE